MASVELKVEVAYSPGAREVEVVALQLPAGSTVGDAVEASGLLSRHPELTAGTLSVGVWGKLGALDQALRDRDRVEVYRPLRVDPKEARRQRHRSARAGR